MYLPSCISNPFRPTLSHSPSTARGTRLGARSHSQYPFLQQQRAGKLPDPISLTCITLSHAYLQVRHLNLLKGRKWQRVLRQNPPYLFDKILPTSYLFVLSSPWGCTSRQGHFDCLYITSVHCQHADAAHNEYAYQTRLWLSGRALPGSVLPWVSSPAPQKQMKQNRKYHGRMWETEGDSAWKPDKENEL